MIEVKDCKTLSNSEICLYIHKLENAHEALRTQIGKLCDEFDLINSEYIKATQELDKRNFNEF